MNYLTQTLVGLSLIFACCLHAREPGERRPLHSNKPSATYDISKYLDPSEQRHLETSLDALKPEDLPTACQQDGLSIACQIATLKKWLCCQDQGPEDESEQSD